MEFFFNTRFNICLKLTNPAGNSQVWFFFFPHPNPQLVFPWDASVGYSHLAAGGNLGGGQSNP